jgi:hypothetical protein
VSTNVGAVMRHRWNRDRGKHGVIPARSNIRQAATLKLSTQNSTQHKTAIKLETEMESADKTMAFPLKNVTRLGRASSLTILHLTLPLTPSPLHTHPHPSLSSPRNARLNTHPHLLTHRAQSESPLHTSSVILRFNFSSPLSRAPLVARLLSTPHQQRMTAGECDQQNQ